MIDVENLNLTFGEGNATHQVLDSITLHVEDGEVFGLIGESGCGKSTILRCMAGLYTDWKGHLSIDGHTLDARIDKDRCRLMQMVFQDPYGSLHPRQTVGTALAEPLKVQRIGDINDRIDAMLVKVGLPKTVRARYPHQLSGGQRQRVAIARALILEPRVLLLDEPTSALDVSVQAEVLNLLSDLQQASGLTYVVVTHDLGVLVHLCDRFAVMRDGRIVETLRRADLQVMEDRHPYTRMLVEASSLV